MCACNSSFEWVRDGREFQKALRQVDIQKKITALQNRPGVFTASWPLFMMLEKLLTALSTHVFSSYFAFLHSKPGSRTLDPCTISGILLWLALGSSSGKCRQGPMEASTSQRNRTGPQETRDGENGHQRETEL